MQDGSALQWNDELFSEAVVSFDSIASSSALIQDDFGAYLEQRDLSGTAPGAVPDSLDWALDFAPFEPNGPVLQKESSGTLDNYMQSSMSPPSSESSSPSQASVIPCVWPNCEKSFASMSAYK